jgi:predicted peptidase
MNKTIRSIALFFTILLCNPGLSVAQDTFQKAEYIFGGDTLPYRVLLPLNYDKTKAYPVVLFLHGAGERGSDNEKQLVHGSKLFLDSINRQKFPSIVIFPQCAADSYWSNVEIKSDTAGVRTFHFNMKEEHTRMMRLLLQFVKQIPGKYKISASRFYVTGLSMGGMGTFEIVRRMPRRFAAALPICGGADPASAKTIKQLPWWVFHGDKDNVVPVSHSENMVNALKKAGASVKFTVYPNVGHNSWDNVFAEPEYLSWMFSQRRK